MKISSNVVGNYSLNPVVNKTTPQKGEELSNEEKNFFINRYPDKKDEISDYHFYQKSGQMSGVSVGQNFDRRG
jgi:hypothetical protein